MCSEYTLMNTDWKSICLKKVSSHSGYSMISTVLSFSVHNTTITSSLHHLASCKISWWCQEREWESVGIRMRPLGSTAYVACLLLLCQLLVFRRSWVWIQAGSWIFFPMDLFLTLSGENNETASFSFFYHTTEKYTVILLYTLYHSILENSSLSYPYNM